MVTTRIKNGWEDIPIAPRGPRKDHHHYPFRTFSFWRLSFGLCNAPGTFQRVVTSIFSDMIGTFIEVFMDDFTVHGDTFDACLENLSTVLERCVSIELSAQTMKSVISWLLTVVVLGLIVSREGIEVDKAQD
ncbi:unnamed protein product [Rhodiola kirilowii]